MDKYIRLQTLINDLAKNKCDGYWSVLEDYQRKCSFWIEKKDCNGVANFIANYDDVPDDYLNREVIAINFKYYEVAIEGN